MKKLIIFLILLLMPQLVLASYISLKTTITTNLITDDSSKIEVDILNSGDESAFSVQISPLLSSDFQVEPNLYDLGTLDPNEPEKINFDVTLSDGILPGSYPLVVLVDYADANGYPFSSVSPSSIIYKTQTLSKVTGVMENLDLSKERSQTLTLTLRNLDGVQHDVDVKLYLPRELKTDKDESTISIGPKEEKNLNFQVSSFSALPGSSYIVLATLDYDDSNSHYSYTARNIINIVKEKPLEFPIWLPILSFIVLLIIFAYYLIRGKNEGISRNSNNERREEPAESAEGNKE